MTEENKLNQKVGKNIRKYRLLYSANIKNLTQRELAEKIGVSVSLISGLESDNVRQGISIYNLYKISKVLDVPIENFFK